MADEPAGARENLPPRSAPTEARGLLAGMRIRKKLIVLHTVFSLVLAGILWLALQPAVRQVVLRAEEHESRLALAALLAAMDAGIEQPPMRRFAERLGPDVTIRWGTAEQLGIPSEIAAGAMPREVAAHTDAQGRGAAAVALADGGFVSVSAMQDTARAAVVRLYALMTVALLAVYALVAAALEIFVLPRHVYEPIRAILAADRAVAEGRRNEETVPDSAIPADELGEIMRSRNASIAALRRNELDLADALARLEDVATDLKRKNHLLEMARQNLADADRLASLGMMSAGVAHELNTPLAVLKGLVEKLNADAEAPSAERRSLSATEAALMLRVLGRLERLSESLLDFARVRPPSSRQTCLRPLVDEAWTLVSLDRNAANVRIANNLDPVLSAWCDGDRTVQVLVNLLRNATDALDGTPDARIEVGGADSIRDGRRWVSITIADNGPGIDAAVLPRLFQPFASTRLDSRGTGLGLAVSEGIVREHGGVLLARNRTDGRGAIFEIMLPAEPA
ncbi:MAG: hypothetical protein KF699_09920 [Phycisphaeraceae bacterium]|nr:hypothetical protein [Phycisphaeraceae bacterium]